MLQTGIAGVHLLELQAVSAFDKMPSTIFWLSHMYTVLMVLSLAENNLVQFGDVQSDFIKMGKSIGSSGINFG